MATYTVECRGEVRELYTVEAGSAAEALKNWSDGHLFHSEASTEPVSATLDDD